MPQKRNPGAMESLRLAATSVLAESQKTLLMAHNTNFGEVSDVRYALKDQVLDRLATRPRGCIARSRPCSTG